MNEILGNYMLILAAISLTVGALWSVSLFIRWIKEEFVEPFAITLLKKRIDATEKDCDYYQGLVHRIGLTRDFIERIVPGSVKFAEPEDGGVPIWEPCKVAIEFELTAGKNPWKVSEEE